ncbi:MAG: recombination mediator RecR [Candidatus Sumerlaeales bacterium]|nr:recombination mediator RecR [Candidatus Sumerlaeales bacterium]
MNDVLPHSFEILVKELSKLPTIGKRSALKLAFHILRSQPEYAETLGNAISTIHQCIKFCKVCGNLAENDLCTICSDASRKADCICVIEDIQDVLAMENSHIFDGVYHVLGGHLSPLHGIMAENLNIASLLLRIENSLKSDAPVNEIILATNPTPDGEATAIYLAKQLKQFPVTVTRPGLGLSMGTNLEFTDELTLRKALERRQSF